MKKPPIKGANVLQGVFVRIICVITLGHFWVVIAHPNPFFWETFTMMITMRYFWGIQLKNHISLCVF